MRLLSTMVLAWAGLTALSLLASALIVLGELRIDGNAMAGVQASQALSAAARQEAPCEPTSSLAGP
jgi:hypothetical protein